MMPDPVPEIRVGTKIRHGAPQDDATTISVVRRPLGNGRHVVEVMVHQVDHGPIVQIGMWVMDDDGDRSLQMRVVSGDPSDDMRPEGHDT